RPDDAGTTSLPNLSQSQHTLRQFKGDGTMHQSNGPAGLLHRLEWPGNTRAEQRGGFPGVNQPAIDLNQWKLEALRTARQRHRGAISPGAQWTVYASADHDDGADEFHRE